MQDKSRRQLEAPAQESLPAPSPEAVQAHFQETLAHQKERAVGLRKQRLNWIVLRFLGSWLFGLLVLVGIGLLSNLEWARPKIQEAMSESFHRQVKLGDLSWMLGLNGLAISTDRLSLIEADGKPFIISGKSEIGVAFLPLFNKRVLIKHVDFDKPEVFATQIAPGKWNFTDLLVEGPEIRFVQVEHGRLHLRNELTEAQLATAHESSIFTNTKWRAYDFEDVNLKLIFPRKNQKRPWPFYLSFKLPRELNGQKYSTDFSLTILANGQLNDWKSNSSKIELRADQFNPADWRPFMRIPDGFNGLFSFNFKGDGRVDKIIAGDIKGSAHDLSVVNGAENIFNAKDAEVLAKVSFAPDEVSWSKSTVSIGGVKLESQGRLWDLNSNMPEYTALVSANLQNLADISDSSLLQLFPGADPKPGGHRSAQQSGARAAANNKSVLAGSAVVEVQFEGKGPEHHVYTKLKADNVPLGNLLGAGTESGAPLLSLFEIEPNAPIKGQISIGTDQRILLNDVQIPAKRSTLKIRGFFDAKKKEHDVYLKADGLDLDQFDTTNLAGNSQKKSLNKNSTALMLTGKVDVNAHMKASGGQQQMDINATLKRASLSSPKAGSLAKDLVGVIRYDGSTIKFEKISGLLENDGVYGGTLKLTGFLQTAENAVCNLEVSGHQIDIAQLVSFARAAHWPLPERAVNEISGTARSLDIRVSGRTREPQLSLNLSPADIRYAFKDQSGTTLKPVHAVGGNVILSDNVLSLRNVVVTMGTSQLIVTANLDNKDNFVVPKLVQLRSRGVDIADVLHYAQSETLSADVRKNLNTNFSALKLHGIQGKAYGDLTIRVNDRAPHSIEGIVGLTNVSGKAGDPAITFEHLSGLLAFSGPDVKLQDVSVSSGGGKFAFSGQVKSFQTSPTWTAHVTGKARGEELQILIPPEVAKSGLELHSRLPVAVRGNFADDGKTMTCAFVLNAAVGDEFRFNSDGFTFRQPSGQPLSIDGTVVQNFTGTNRSVNLHNGRIAMGDATIQASARYTWSTDSSRKPFVDFMVSTVNPIPTGIGVGAMLPGIDVTGSAGTLKGTFAAAGEVGHLLTHGDLYMDSVTIPSLRVKDLNGKIDSPRWVISPADPADKGRSEARVYISNVSLGGVDTREARATLKVESGANPKVSLNNGSAVMAGGKAAINGYYIPDSGRWCLDLGLEKLQVDQFMADIIEQSGELTGLADGKLVLESTADGAAMSNLTGKGNIAIYKGSAPRLGQLHEKLCASNLLQQGIFGFNFNNVLHSILPGKSGKFKEVSINFTIDKGIMDIDRLNFDGDGLRLRAAGEWNIPADSLVLDVAGNIPRVASSILPGAVGEATRNLTLQKAVRVMTFRKLENLPSLPILGDIGTDEPRAFTFKVATNQESPDAMTRSIEKSFKWLPNKPNASAHPIPGL